MGDAVSWVVWRLKIESLLKLRTDMIGQDEPVFIHIQSDYLCLSRLPNPGAQDSALCRHGRVPAQVDILVTGTYQSATNAGGLPLVNILQ